MIDHHVLLEIQETTEVQDIQETTEVQDSRDNDRQDTTVTCSDCNVECTVPFVPRNDKPVYCSDCFRKYKPDDSGDDRPSRDDRGSRYSETTEVQEIQEIILDQVEEKVINF